MPADTTTFFLSFAAVFLGLGYYLWRLERRVTDLARRIEATTDKNAGPPGSP